MQPKSGSHSHFTAEFYENFWQQHQQRTKAFKDTMQIQGIENAFLQRMVTEGQEALVPLPYYTKTILSYFSCV